MRDDDRQREWIAGIAARANRTPIEATLAEWTLFESDLEGVGAALRLIWHPNGRRILLNLMAQARRQPGTEGLTVAVKSAIGVWTDVWHEPPRKKGGRPKKWESRAIIVWLAFQEAYGTALATEPHLSKEEMKRRFLKVSRKLSGQWKLSSLGQLNDALKLVNKRTPRHEQARIVRQFFPDLAERLVPKVQGKVRHS